MDGIRKIVESMDIPSSNFSTTSFSGTHISLRLLDKVAIITGASSGFGRAIALAYAAEGAKVVCADLNPLASTFIDEASIQATHHLVQKSGGKSVFVKCDVGNSEDVQNLVRQAVKVYGRLDIMVNNAGIAPADGANIMPPIHEISEDVYDKTMLVNAKGVFLGCKYAGLQMIKQDVHPSGDRGWIVNMASVASLVGVKGIASYAASKGAVAALTRTVAMDYAQYHIHCNAISPGFARTALSKALFDHPPSKAALAALHPLRGLGEAEDISKVAVFLASNDASWVTGVNIPVDGGYSVQ